MKPFQGLMLLAASVCSCDKTTDGDSSADSWDLTDGNAAESPPEEDLPPASFEEVLVDVLVPSCGFDACHGSGAGYLRIHAAQTEEEWLDKQSTVIADLRLIEPGHASQSYLIMKMEGASTIQGDIMPPNGPLTNARIARVRSWIDALE